MNRASEMTMLNFSMAAITQGYQVRDLVCLIVIIIELAIGFDMMHGKLPMLTLFLLFLAYLTAIPVSHKREATLRSPILTAIANCAATIVYIASAPFRFGRSFVFAFVRAEFTVSHCHKIMSDFIWLTTFLANQGHVSVISRLFRRLVAKNPRAAFGANAIFSAAPIFEGFAAYLTDIFGLFTWIAFVSASAFASTERRTKTMPLMRNSEGLSADRAIAPRCFGRLMMARVGAILSIFVLAIKEFLTTVQTVWHSVLTNADSRKDVGKRRECRSFRSYPSRRVYYNSFEWVGVKHD